MRWLLIGGAIGTAAYLMFKGGSVERFNRFNEAEKAETLARMFVVELRGGGNQTERAGMAWAAINRANAWGASLRAVIRSEVRGKQVWGGPGYNEALDVAHRKPEFAGDLETARAVLAGQLPNPIGARRNFLHKWSMHRTQPRHSDGTPDDRFVLDPESGRWVPTWALKATAINVGSTPTTFS